MTIIGAGYVFLLFFNFILLEEFDGIITTGQIQYVDIYNLSNIKYITFTAVMTSEESLVVLRFLCNQEKMGLKLLSALQGKESSAYQVENAPPIKFYLEGEGFRSSGLKTKSYR